MNDQKKKWAWHYEGQELRGEGEHVWAIIEAAVADACYLEIDPITVRRNIDRLRIVPTHRRIFARVSRPIFPIVFIDGDWVYGMGGDFLHPDDLTYDEIASEEFPRGMNKDPKRPGAVITYDVQSSADAREPLAQFEWHWLIKGGMTGSTSTLSRAMSQAEDSLHLSGGE